MQKGIKGHKLSRTTNERKQLFCNLVRALALKGSIDTSLAKAQAIRSWAEKLVTTAKAKDLNAQRRLMKETGNQETMLALLQAGQVMMNRKGGFTRMIRLGTRAGDNSEMVRLEWTDKVVVPEIVKTKIKPQKEIKANKVTDKKVEKKEKKK